MPATSEKCFGFTRNKRALIKNRISFYEARKLSFRSVRMIAFEKLNLIKPKIGVAGQISMIRNSFACICAPSFFPAFFSVRITIVLHAILTNRIKQKWRCKRFFVNLMKNDCRVYAIQTVFPCIYL